MFLHHSLANRMYAFGNNLFRSVCDLDSSRSAKRSSMREFVCVVFGVLLCFLLWFGKVFSYCFPWRFQFYFSREGGSSSHIKIFI